ncbi:hypothetical protein GCM10010840_11750 [Deinococcus aerolatus]|uniref:DUF4393 domain-containing protein n=1 Tax=Deinococcus aerolatus TaxID=522487 RepID=A0ABQ2G542_9DEIO|nr:DUF4393 domain-containing protein [Deinococcus aerolatus]GGL75278.1 hypothetical protein GCM10010840_11750 [Deinococcus aerolatus]
MPEDNSTPNNPVSALIDKLVGPVYDDLLKPAIQEVGKGVGGLASYYMHGWQAQGAIARANLNLLQATLEPKLEAIPEEQRIPVDPAILVPVLQASSYAAQHEDIREMFANLLASAANADKAKSFHSSFVEVVRQLSPLDARILRSFTTRMRSYIPAVKIVARIDNSETDTLLHFTDLNDMDEDLKEIELAIENLSRLGIVKISYERWLIKDEEYIPMINLLKSANAEIDDARYSPPRVSASFTESDKIIPGFYQPGIISLTPFGDALKLACI